LVCAGSGPLKPGEIGVVAIDDGSTTPFKVKTPSGKEWWYKAKALKLVVEDKSKAEPTLPVRVGDTVTLAFAPKEEKDKDVGGLGGCCGVTEQDFRGGATVVRGPDWKWSDQDGGAGLF
jgi:hypothetical protein